MDRVGSTISFSKQDIEGLVVNKYSDLELKNKEMIYRKNMNKRRVAFLSIIIIIVAISYFVQPIKYLMSIILLFMCFLVVVYESADRIDLKAVRRKYYIEIIVDEKLADETLIDGTLSPGSHVTTFYPIMGRDATTNYRSKFYIEKSQYDNASIGERVRISIEREKL